MRTRTPLTLKMLQGAREPSVHAHFIFRFENGQENQSLFSAHDQNTADHETSQPQAQPRDG